MGCFRACFSLSKSPKLPKSAIKTSLRDHIEKSSEPIQPADFEQKIQEIGQELVEDSRRTQNKVTIDPIIEENETCFSDRIQKASQNLHPADSKPKIQDELENYTDHSIPFKQNPREEVQGSGKSYETESTMEVDDSTRVQKREESEAVEDLLPYPATYRYGNFNTDDEESEDMELDINYLDEDQKRTVIPDESSESLFSLSIDLQKQSDNEEKEVNSGMKTSDLPELEAMEMVMKKNLVENVSLERETFSDLEAMEMVMNPVENVTKWKLDSEKTAQTFGHFQERENVSLERESDTPFLTVSELEAMKMVMNPVENFTQGKPAREKTAQPFGHNEEKEILSLERESDTLFSTFSELEAMKMATNPVENFTRWKQEENVSLERDFDTPFSTFSDLEATKMVMNPVENLTQWKQERENVSLEREFDTPFLTFSTRNPKQKTRKMKGDIAVDTSLSSWLVESENTPKSKNSSKSIGNYSPLEKGSSGRSFEDRPILGALTMEDLKQFSASSSPIRSRSRSPVDTPIIGTVGSYWTHTGQSKDLVSSSPTRGLTNSAGKFREEGNIRRKKTPFAARLEKAL